MYRLRERRKFLQRLRYLRTLCLKCSPRDVSGSHLTVGKQFLEHLSHRPLCETNFIKRNRTLRRETIFQTLLKALGEHRLGAR